MVESLKREIKCVLVDTSLDTHLLVPLHDRETISDFKVNLCKGHLQCFPKVGEIDISAVKVTRQNKLGLRLDYHLPDSTLLSMVLDSIDCWFVFVDAVVKVENCELPSENCLNHELLLEKDKNDLELEAEKTTKKRELERSNGEKSRKKSKLDLNQSSATADVDELCGNVEVEVVATESSPKNKLDDTLPETTRKETEMGEKSAEDVEKENIETDTHLDTSSELTTRPCAAAISTSNVESVAATPPESLPASGGENRGNPFAEASQKEIEKSVEDEGGIDKIETDDLVSHMENHLDTNTGLTARPDTEKKERLKKSSEVDTNQTSATANVEERVDATPASLPISRGENLDDSCAEASQKENELVQISIDDVGRDQTETDNLVADHLNTVSEVTTKPNTEKKKRRKKRSKDAISQSFSTCITTSRDIVNKTEGVHANVDSVDAANVDSVAATEASQEETEMGEKIHDTVGCGKTIPSAADNIRTSNVEGDADEDKSVKPSMKKKSQKSKILAEEDTLVVSSDAHNVKAIKTVEGEEPDNIIRNVSGSLQENNAALEVADSQEFSDEANNAALEVADSQEFSDEANNATLEVAQSQELSVEVNNAALEETPLMNNPQVTESDASLLRKCSEIAEDKSLSKKSLKEKADVGDNFGCSQIQVAGGAKSKMGRDLHPSGSSNGLLNSMKPKEKKSRALQPASSSTDHLQSRVVPNKTSDDSDGTFMSRKLSKQSGRRNKYVFREPTRCPEKIIQGILRRSSSYKKTLIRA